MPINKIVPTRRAKAAIAAVVAAFSAGGAAYVQYGAPTADTPPAVTLAIKELIKPWEGRKLVAYFDRLAKPPVWTICDGDTENVKPGMVETPAGCDRRLEQRVTRDYFRPLTRCIVGFEQKPLSWQASMTSLSYNIGPVKTCNSTAARMARAGHMLASCEAATAFNQAGGNVYTGLVNRREMGDAQRIGEAELCVSGL
jgi:GH24 family phage-related lysozyme (muramidase)